MDFTNSQSESKKLGIGGSMFSLDSGENIFRVLTKPEPQIQHFLKEEQKYASCAGKDTCTHCKSGLKRDCKIILYILTRPNDEIRLAKLPWAVFIGIGDLSQSSQFGFKGLPPYDIIVTKKGEGLNTRYSTVAGRNESPIPQEILFDLAQKKPVPDILASWAQKRDEQNAMEE